MFFMNYGALGVFIGTVIEEIIAPIPSTVVVLTSSFFMLGNLPVDLGSILSLILYIGLPVGFGMVIGSSVIYGLCYYLGKPFVSKWGKYLGLKWDDIEKFKRKIDNQKRDSLLIYIARTVPVIPSVAISGFCGVVRYDFTKYVILTFLGGFTRAVILGFIGWQFGAYTQDISLQMDNLENIFIILIIIAVIGYILYKKVYQKRNESKEE